MSLKRAFSRERCLWREDVSGDTSLEKRCLWRKDVRDVAGYQLECLHGRHRIQAGREFLSPRNKWWAVDLYLAGIEISFNDLTYLTFVLLDTNIALKRCLIEEYSNEEKPTDGEIYRKIREYHFQRNFSFEMRWWACLKGNRTKNLKGLLRNYELTAAFDSLLDIPGLDDGMMLTMLYTIMALKC
jgi:hypothetical protein